MSETTIREHLRGNRYRSAGKWLVVALLAVIATCLLIEVGFATSPAGAQVTAGAGAGKIFVVAGQVSRDTYGLYLIDTQNATICMYEWLPGTRKFRLMAARNYSFDLKLDDYNTTPSPREVKKLISNARRVKTTTTAP